MRRKFYEIAANGPAPIAQKALERIQKLYKIEDGIRGQPPERHAVQQAQSRPEIEDLKSRFEDCLRRVSKTSPVRDAIKYGLNHWDGLCRFLDDGRIEIDSNTVERSIRGLALTRRIRTVRRSRSGRGRSWAMIASLLETCKLKPSIRSPGPPTCSPSSSTVWPASRIDELMPWAYVANTATL